MSNKILIPSVALISLLIGGGLSFLLFKVNTTQAPIVSKNQQILDSVAQKVLDSVSSTSSISKVATSKSISKSSSNSKLIRVHGTITAPVKIAENLPKLCLEGNTEKYCDPKIKVISPNIFEYEFTNVISNVYDLTYSYKDEIDPGFAELPESGILNDPNTDFEIIEFEDFNNTVKINIPVTKFKELSDKKFKK